jgi:selenocysteine lyase/cysteine desulfurase
MKAVQPAREAKRLRGFAVADVDVSSLGSRAPAAATSFTLPRDASGHPSFAELRAREFWRLDAAGEAYLDFTGTALYAESQVQEHLALLRASVLGNPHSESPSSLRSTDHIEAVRALTLDLLDADPDDYAVIFTPNASGAMRVVGESFAFVPRSPLVLASDNHNSMNGIREYARTRGVATEYVPLDAELRMRDADASLQRVNGRGPGLFAFPAQSNFSGVQHPLELVGIAHERGYRVLLDAAAFVPTNALSLRRVPADFVALSYYKIFGYPSGIGALVARRDALAALRRPWFAGGTIDFVSTQNDLHRLKQGGAAFEDGTPNFLAASALVPGFALLEAIGIDAVHRHVMRLTSILLQRLAALRRPSGEPAVSIYGPAGVEGRGATVAFNLVGSDGRHIPFADVEARARASGISIRGGCFCNPGASEHAFGFPAERARECLERVGGGEAFSIPRFAECMPGVPIGALRASLGIPSNDADVDRLIDLVATITNSA